MGAFVVYGQDNDSYAFREYPPLTEYQRSHQELIPDMSSTSRSGVRRCGACGELLAKWDEPLSRLVLKKRKYDISITYDGVTAVSERFKIIYERNNLCGLAFRPLPDDSAFYAIFPSRAVEFDSESRKTRFINRCQQCGHFDSVVGATPVYLKAGVRIGDREFVRTDLEFGSHDEKHPLLLCGESAGQALSSAALRGLDLIPVDEIATEPVA